MSGRCRVAQLAIIKQMSGRCRVAQLAIIKQMSGQVSRGSAGDNQSHGDYQADERAGAARLSCRLSSRRAGRCHGAQLAILKQLNGQVSRGSAGDYQEDEQAGVTQLSWRLSSS